MHGHVLDLLEKGVDGVFLPFVVNEEAEPGNPTQNCNCPWIQTYPFILKSALRDGRDPAKLLIPTLHFRYSRRLLNRELARFLHEKFGIPERDVPPAVSRAARAQKDFENRLRSRGKEVLGSLPPGKTAAVILGRPYNCGDPALNLRIVEKLISLDVLPIPADFLPLDEEAVFGRYPSMYWPNGRRLLQASRIVARDERLQAIHLGNFRCGPDSFISHYVREELRGKPYLQLEMDEHSADAGLVTRLEAFFDSVRARREAGSANPVSAGTAPAGAVRLPRNGRGAPARTLYFPYMADGAYALAAACRACGMKAEVLPPQDARDVELGRRHTSSRECFPMICTTGSFLRKLQEPGIDPARVSFFMPDHNGPCRFGQYNKLQRIILDRLGFPDAEIVHPSNEDSYAGLTPGSGVRFRLAMWRGIVAVDLLRKLLQERRPYEVQPGSVETVYRRQLACVVDCIEKGGRGIKEVLSRACADFSRVQVDRGRRKPVISVTGEIFMRDNPFCSGDLVKKLERLGAETVMGPVRDWVSYSTWRFTRDSRRKGRVAGFVRSKLQGLLQRLIEEGLVHVAERGGAEMSRDIPVQEMLELCMPYLHRDYDGEPAITMGGVAGQCRTGISGVVHILPFTCLPGTLISALSPGFSQDHDGIPWINIAYDGQEEASVETRLQAFVYRAEEYARRNGYDAPRAW
jgi:predicted nucleotide-binding protein (sugar kinase/HSP70/actin superfamily)